MQIQLHQNTQSMMAGVNYLFKKPTSYHVREKTPVKVTRAREALVDLKGRKFSCERGVMFAKHVKSAVLVVLVSLQVQTDHLLIPLSREAERDRRILSDGKQTSGKKLEPRESGIGGNLEN